MLSNYEHIKPYDIPEKHEPDLETILKAEMRERSLSLRKMSGLCGISPSTLSRILANKQAASISHLQAFSKHLHIPLALLLKASGLDIEIAVNFDENSKIILNTIFSILKTFNINYERILPDILKELKKCEQYAKSSAGKEAIKNGFHSKLENLNGEGIIIDQIKKIYQLYISDETHPHIKPIAGSVLLYFIHTPDIIPDYAFPVGYLDDAIAVALTVQRLAEDYNVILS